MNKFFIPIIEGTIRKERRSIHVAKLIETVLKDYLEIETELVDPKDFEILHDGNDEDNKIERYTDIVERADGFIIVVPEYNHGYPGSLKRLLDTELKNYNHKPVAFAGVSAGPWGGTRAIESLVNVVREMGMVATHTDVNFSFVQNLFDENGNLTDEKFIDRSKRMIDELVWMTKALKFGRKN